MVVVVSSSRSRHSSTRAIPTVQDANSYGCPHIRLVRSMLTLGLSRKGMCDLEVVGEFKPPSEIQLTQSCGSQVFPS